MILAKVWYELFEHEAEWLELHPDPEEISLGRQLRLDLLDSSTLFITWTWGPDGGDYHMGSGPESFCNSPEMLRVVSAASLWAPLVGQPISLAYQGADQQVLEVRGGASVVFCCSYG